MRWGEVHRLLLILLTDPSSQVAVAVRGWEHPVSREDMILRDIYDLQHVSKAKRKPDPYPRPWDAKPKKIGGTVAVSIDEFRQIKRRLASGG